MIVTEVSGLKLERGEEGLYLTDGMVSVKGDFTSLIHRVRKDRLSSELLVKAAKIKNAKGFGMGEKLPLAVDATAGLGEDSFILAAAGYRVLMYEYNPTIAVLLKDAVERALKESGIAEIAERMEVIQGDSLEGLRKIKEAGEEVDIVLLDPMFPERQKSALVKKKFQLLQQLELPCHDEKSLLDGAMSVSPRRILIKRPLKGPYLAGVKPDYSLKGKAIRIDCINLAVKVSTDPAD